MSVEEHSAAHRVPGESLGERLGARGRQDRRCGPSDAFYARFGLKSPWVPEGPVGGAARDFGMVYLSSAAFLDHMASLADRREARIARYDGIGRRFSRRKPSALRRSGASVRAFSAWGNVGLIGDGDLVFPEHPELMAGTEEPAAGPGPARSPRGPSMRPVASPWLSFESRPARVFGGSHRSAAAPVSPTGAPVLTGHPESGGPAPRLTPGLRPSMERVAPPRRARPLDRVARRVAAIEVQPARVSSSRRGGASAPEPAGVAAQRAGRRAVQRQARRALGPAARVASARLEAGLPDAAASPVTMAAARMPRAGERPRGVQRALWGSPAAAVLARPVAAAEAAAAERAPVSRSPVRDTWTPARVVRQAASEAVATARVIRGNAGSRPSADSASARAVRRAAAPARPRAIRMPDAASGPVPVAGASSAPVARPSLTDLGAAPARRARRVAAVDAQTPVPAQGRRARVPATARALDRGRAPSAARLVEAPTGLSSMPAIGGATIHPEVTGAPRVSSDASPAQRAALRVESGTAAPGSVVPRPLPALQRLDRPAPEQGWLDAGFARTEPPAVRRLSVARSSQGVFAPAAVVVAPDLPSIPDADASGAPAARSSRQTATGATAVSGWARNELPASTTRVVRGGQPVDAASPARHAERRVQAAAASPAGGRASDLVRAGRTEVRSSATTAAQPSRRPATVAAAREGVGADGSRSVRPPAVPRLARRGRGQATLADAGAVTLQPALAPAPDVADAPSSLVRAARRRSASPVVGRTARRVLEAEAPVGAARSRHARANPVAHAAPRVSQTVRLTAATARQLGVPRAGVADTSTGEGGWLVSGATATRVVAAARRAEPSADAPGSLGAQLAAEAAASSARGAVRPSQLWAPEAVTARAGSADAPATEGSDASRGHGQQRSTGERLAALPAEQEAGDVALRLAATPAGRPLDWLDDRTFASLTPPRRRAALSAARGSAARGDVGRTDGAGGLLPLGGTARRGRHLVRTPEGRYVPASLARRPASVTADFVVPATTAGADPVGSQGRDPVTGAPVVNGWARPQAALSDTLSSVEDRASDAHLPVWARRASGAPLVGGSNSDLVSALARAADPEQVVRVIMEKGDVGGTVASSLSAPALQVIEKIKTVAREEVSEAIRTEVQARTVAARKAGRRSEAPRSTARVVQGFTGLRRGSSARSGSGVGDDKVMKLAKKLQSLIDLAEGRGDRNAARRQVRMAEDSAAARGEGQSSPQAADGGHASSVDVDALTREVVEAATRELDQRRERRQEDSDERGFWW